MYIHRPIGALKAVDYLKLSTRMCTPSLEPGKGNAPVSISSHELVLMSSLLSNQGRTEINLRSIFLDHQKNLQTSVSEQTNKNEGK
jgi:hypothetical protein